LNRVLQGLNDMVLAQNVVENLGPVFSRKDLVAHGHNVAGICPASQDEPQGLDRPIDKGKSQY